MQTNNPFIYDSKKCIMTFIFFFSFLGRYAFRVFFLLFFSYLYWSSSYFAVWSLLFFSFVSFLLCSHRYLAFYLLSLSVSIHACHEQSFFICVWFVCIYSWFICVSLVLSLPSSLLIRLHHIYILSKCWNLCSWCTILFLRKLFKHITSWSMSHIKTIYTYI